VLKIILRKKSIKFGEAKEKRNEISWEFYKESIGKIYV